MEKYTKRLLAFLLATVMVLTGLPMSAKEAKAADERVAEVITLDFGRPITGVLSNRAADWGGASEPIIQGITGTYEKNGDTRTYTVTNTLAGTNWRLVPSRTIPALAEGETTYPTDNTGVRYFMWTGAKSDWGDTSTARTVLYLYGNKSLSFDFDVPETKEYKLSLVYYDSSTPRKINIIVDSETETPFTTTFLAKDAADTSKMVVEELEGSVVLTAGVHTLDIKSTQTKNANESMIRALILTEVLPPVYEAATFNLADGTEFLKGDTFELGTTAVLDNGTDISEDISVTYTSDDTSVATIEGNTLSLVGRGDATITAEVSYGGEVKETFTSKVTVKVDGEFTLDFSEVDTTTIQNDGEDRLYFTDTTKSTVEATTQWEFVAADSHKDTYWPKLGLRYFHSGLVPTYLRVMSSGDKTSVIKFTAPSAGTYNVSARIYPLEAGGYLKVFVNDVFVGVVDAALGNERTQNLLGVTLEAGANTISFTSAGKSTGTSYYCNLYGFDFVPVTEGEKNVITSLTATINGADSTTLDIANGTTGKVDAIVETTGNVRMWPTMKSEHTSVVTVQVHHGTLTLKRAGSSDITVTAGDFEKVIPLKITDSRPVITWVNEDGTELATNRVAVGGTAEFEGETPVKEADAQYSYTFAGWTVDGETLVEDFTVAEDVTYTALYTATVNEYKVTFMVNGEVAKEENVAYGEMPVAPEVGDIEIEGVAYIFKGWDAEIVPVTGEVTYTAILEAAAQSYTITFVDEDGDVLYETTVEAGVTPEYKGETPTKAGDAQYTYTFAGWTPEIAPATVGATYTATYESTVNEYEVLWTDGAGKVLETDLVPYGTVPTYDGETPVKEADKINTYVFAGWDRTVEAVTGATSYAAQFEPTAIEYTITFVVNGEEFSNTYCYGAEVAVPEVEGYEDTFFTYAFANWDKDVVAVEGDATYTAVFEATAKAYAEAINANDRTFGEVTADGNVVTVKVTGEVEYAGSVVSQGVWNNWVGFAVEVPAGIDAAQAKVLSVASGSVWTLAECLDAETTANFYWGIATATTTERTYQIDWNGDGEYDLDVVIDVADATLLTKTFDITWVVNGEATTVAVTAGTMPEAPAVEDYATVDKTYAFEGWDAEIAVAEADATYTAVFTATTNTYTVTWMNHNGAVIAEDVVEYGTVPAAPEASYKEYTFTGWDKEIAAVEGDVTYTAIYDIDGIDEGYYYVDGKVKGNAGTIQIGEDLYYVCYSGKIAAGQNMTVPANKTNGLVEAGTYYFYEDGTMKNPADDFKGQVGEDGYYYVKGEVRGNVGLVKIDDFCYYVHYSGKVVKDGNQTVSAAKANTDKTGIEAGTYYFFEDGVMLTNELKTTGGVVGEDGFYYVRGKLTKNVGLVKLGDDFYYVHYSGKVVQNGYQTVTAAKANGYTEYVGVRKFVDGVMVK